MLDTNLSHTMPRKVITVTHPDGTKKVIVGQPSNGTPVKTREPEKDRRPKPEHGGKVKLKTC